MSFRSATKELQFRMLYLVGSSVSCLSIFSDFSFLFLFLKFLKLSHTVSNFYILCFLTLKLCYPCNGDVFHRR